MRIQWTLILALIFSLIVAIFAVINVNPVTVKFLFGRSEIPLILVIIGSALLGGLVVGLFGILRQYKLQWKVKKLEKDLENMTVSAEGNELVEAETITNEEEQKN